MKEPVHPMSAGGSAPVAIVLALALATTVGVSAQSWDPRVRSPGVTAPGAMPVDADAIPLWRHVFDWAMHERSLGCGAPSR